MSTRTYFRAIARHLAVAVLAAGILAAMAVRASGRHNPTPEQLARQRAATPVGMVYVPAGAFWVGSDDSGAGGEARPPRRVFVRERFPGRSRDPKAAALPLPPRCS